MSLFNEICFVLVSSFVAEQLGIKDYVLAYLDPHLQPSELLTGVSFASGASGFDPQTTQIHAYDQLNLFKEYIGKVKGMVGEERTNYILSNSFYLVLAGSDDFANTYFTVDIRKLQYDINSYTDLVVNYASNFVKELYQLGAKRIGLFGAAPIGCLPSQRTLAGGELRVCSEIYNQAAQLMNSKLSSAITSYNNSLNDPQARIVYTDTYNPLLNIILNHDKYGFSIADKWCCGTGNLEVSILCNQLTDTCSDDSVYVFWDSYHPTERGYRVLVNQILQSSLNKFF
ncbi:GDSL esterase/lipase EXL3 [Camellia lanceoleosa]|uniref:GDSL esterase/lipase EXL3 n=1 Tax=Camellia lanceoleosa TaxID=1840588 RepID=A0ACC0HT70_9ERIC|nr:GDSL esterase/lipase EXL3 [Camellia lanceoleosa]